MHQPLSSKSADLLLAEKLIEQGDRIEKLEAELKALRSGQTVAVEYNLSPAMKEGAIRNKLIELGWTPPEGKDDGGT
jgi:hypothetical protein